MKQKWKLIVIALFTLVAASPAFAEQMNCYNPYRDPEVSPLLDETIDLVDGIAVLKAEVDDYAVEAVADSRGILSITIVDQVTEAVLDVSRPLEQASLSALSAELTQREAKADHVEKVMSVKCIAVK